MYICKKTHTYNEKNAVFQLFFIKKIIMNSFNQFQT